MKVKCPYCDIPVRVDIEGESDEYEYHAKECPHCERKFSYRANISVEFVSVEQAPCLNGGPHTLVAFQKIVEGWRLRDALQCVHCGFEEEIKP